MMEASTTYDGGCSCMQGSACARASRGDGEYGVGPRADIEDQQPGLPRDACLDRGLDAYGYSLDPCGYSLGCRLWLRPASASLGQPRPVAGTAPLLTRNGRLEGRRAASVVEHALIRVVGEAYEAARRPGHPELAALRAGCAAAAELVLSGGGGGKQARCLRVVEEARVPRPRRGEPARSRCRCRSGQPVAARQQRVQHGLDVAQSKTCTEPREVAPKRTCVTPAVIVRALSPLSYAPNARVLVSTAFAA